MDAKTEKSGLLEVPVSIVPSGKDKRTIICVNKRKIWSCVNRGYVRNAGVCLHACTCVFVCQHIVPCPPLPPPLWRYKAIVELSGDDKAQSTGKHIFWKMRLIGNLKRAFGRSRVVNRLSDHVSCSFRVHAGEAHDEIFNTLKETRRFWNSWVLMPAQTPHAAGSSDKVPPQGKFTSALCVRQLVEVEGSVSTFDNPNTAAEKKCLSPALLATGGSRCSRRWCAKATHKPTQLFTDEVQWTQLAPYWTPERTIHWRHVLDLPYWHITDIYSHRLGAETAVSVSDAGWSFLHLTGQSHADKPLPPPT